MENVAGKPEYAAKQKELRDTLDTWMKETADPRAIGETDFFDKVDYRGRRPNELQADQAALKNRRP